MEAIIILTTQIVVGAMITHLFYMEKVMHTHKESFSFYPSEAFMGWACTLMTLLWEVFLPIELLTGFRIWKKGGLNWRHWSASEMG